VVFKKPHSSKPSKLSFSLLKHNSSLLKKKEPQRVELLVLL
jgi:hypothetical protein